MRGYLRFLLEFLVRSLFEGRRRFLKRVSSGSRFSCSGCATKRPQTPWNRITIPDDPLQVGRRDRAVQPGGRAADACGVDRRRPAGIGCHAGDPGADTAAELAHWMLERFRLLGLISALCRIVRREIGERRCFALIDDTLAPRSSAQAPGVAVRFDPAANGRCSCCASASSRSWCRAGIARCRWSPACAEVRATPVRSPWPCCARSAPSCLLLDAWYRRGSLIRTALRLGHEVIGQATPPCSPCHLPVSPEGAAGSMARALMPRRSRRCPPRSTPSPAMAGPAAPYRVPPTLPQGRHRPWCELEKGSGWAKARLLLSTDPTLSAPVEAYSRRWSIEPLFRDLKMVDGLGAMWQRGRIALLRWLHAISAQFGRVQTGGFDLGFDIGFNVGGANQNFVEGLAIGVGI